MPNQPLKGLGIPGVDESNPGFSDILVTGLPALGVTNVPRTQNESQNRQISADTSWNKGTHSFKFGVQAYWLQTNFYSSQLATRNVQFQRRIYQQQLQQDLIRTTRVPRVRR